MTVAAQGEIWWSEVETGRRPVLVVTRSQSIPILNHLMIAPITRTVRGIPTEVGLPADEGLGVDCCASFDNLQLVPKAVLTERVLAATPGRRQQICAALAALADC